MRKSKNFKNFSIIIYSKNTVIFLGNARGYILKIFRRKHIPLTISFSAKDFTFPCQ